MPNCSPGREYPDITRLIGEWRAGDRSAENRLFESLYETLHCRALQCLRRERDDHSLGPTRLVHDAYLALAKSRRMEARDREHFMRLASRVMKHLVIDHARARKAVSNGGGLERVEWNERASATRPGTELPLIVAEAMRSLASRSPQLARLVELRYFCGFSEEEVAGILGVSVRTVKRQWAVAKARLLEALDGTR
ncbi:MAG: ECF-type sigma factor [Bryobacteraceae bacterium]